VLAIPDGSSYKVGSDILLTNIGFMPEEVNDCPKALALNIPAG